MSRERRELRAEGFTVKASMRHAKVTGPPPTGIFQVCPAKPTIFRKCYDRGELPITLDHSRGGQKIAWKVDIDTLDFDYYLPLFFDGLCETTHPYEIFARQGSLDLLDRGGPKILRIVPRLIVPIRNALNTRNNQVMCTTIKILQRLVTSGDQVGEALVPYFRQILPVFNLFKNKKKNLGDQPDYSQCRGENIGELIEETLQMFERYGGETAYVNIKYMVPTYQSCVMN